ncbi:translation initiation factor IF-2-like [Dermacentor silvarum]|uniref:translation initiation factor IF-2-like n=1 Tax=Dermacentor silvarum TaxID=543639 RepID=UPI002100A9E2|nr:translation initiation factor IF-2-like [Dermacentor silvarum]
MKVALVTVPLVVVVIVVTEVQLANARSTYNAAGSRGRQQGSSPSRTERKPTGTRNSRKPSGVRNPRGPRRPVRKPGAQVSAGRNRPTHGRGRVSKKPARKPETGSEHSPSATGMQHHGMETMGGGHGGNMGVMGGGMMGGGMMGGGMMGGGMMGGGMMDPMMMGSGMMGGGMMDTSMMDQTMTDGGVTDPTMMGGGMMGGMGYGAYGLPGIIGQIGNSLTNAALQIRKAVVSSKPSPDLGRRIESSGTATETGASTPESSVKPKKGDEIDNENGTTEKKDKPLKNGKEEAESSTTGKEQDKPKKDDKEAAEKNATEKTAGKKKEDKAENGSSSTDKKKRV